MATGETHFESNGKSIEVTLSHTVAAQRMVYVDGWGGVAMGDGDSGDTVALDISEAEYQFEVPAGLTVENGDTVYIDTTDLTGHYPDGTGWATSSGSNLIPFFKATSGKDANNIVTGVLVVREA